MSGKDHWPCVHTLTHVSGSDSRNKQQSPELSPDPSTRTQAVHTKRLNIFLNFMEKINSDNQLAKGEPPYPVTVQCRLPATFAGFGVAKVPVRRGPARLPNAGFRGSTRRQVCPGRARDAGGMQNRSTWVRGSGRGGPVEEHGAPPLTGRGLSSPRACRLAVRKAAASSPSG